MGKFALFENFSISNEDSFDESLWPIKIKLNPGKALNIISEYLQKKELKEMKIYADNNEIYVNEGDFQITYHLLLEQGGKTIVGVSVYGKRKRGKTRNKLRFLHLELKEILKKYI